MYSQVIYLRLSKFSLKAIMILPPLVFSDDYVRGKLGKATISGRDRCDLCELAIKEHKLETNGPSWLNVSRAECEYRHGFVDFGPTAEALCQYLNSLLVVLGKYIKKPLYVIYVCGLDHFNKCSDVQRLAQKKYIKCAVIYRKNNNEQNISKLDPSSNIIYVPLNNERSDILDISSTEIRRCWKNQPDQLIHLTYPSVIKRLKKMKFYF